LVPAAARVAAAAGRHPRRRARGRQRAGGRLMNEERLMQTKPLVTGDPPAAEPGVPVTSVRILYPDLHGVARGKDVPISELDHAIEKGLCFCSAVMGTDLRHTPVVGGEEGYPDLIARPDVSTMVTHPWEPGVASCLSDLEPAHEGASIADPRGAVRAAVQTINALGFEPVIGPELEFFLLKPDAAA